MRSLRFGLLLLLAALGAWLGRLMAHAKVPPPEGHWREVSPAELSART